MTLLILILGLFPATSLSQQFDPFKDAAKGKLRAKKPGATKKPAPKKSTSKSANTSKRSTKSPRPRPRPRPTSAAKTAKVTPKATPRPTPKPRTPPTPTPPPVLAVTPPEKPEPGHTYINPRDGAVLVWVPGGAFMMGSKDRTAPPDEKPSISVQLTGFWMYKYPVTVAQFRKFHEATGHPMPERPGWGWEDDHPVVNISWSDAVAYCKWAGVSLPTEAQWEYAARGQESRLYPWGNVFEEARIWYSTSIRNGVARVNRTENISESPFGIVDMVGNVWQWCSDWYEKDFYRRAPAPKNRREPLLTPQLFDPTGPGIGAERVLRGGSWAFRPVSAANFFQASRRYADTPGKGDPERGFRGVFNVPPASHATGQPPPDGQRNPSP